MECQIQEILVLETTHVIPLTQHEFIKPGLETGGPVHLIVQKSICCASCLRITTVRSANRLVSQNLAVDLLVLMTKAKASLRIVIESYAIPERLATLKIQC